MLEDFRSRMGDLRQEIDRLAGQAEELEHVVQEQQVRLEEMDLLVRQRDEQLVEQQARVEELEATLDQRNQELAELRALLTEQEEARSRQKSASEDIRAQLADREAAEVALREELAQAEAQLAERVAVPAEPALPAQAFLERFALLEDLVRRQGESLAMIQPQIQEEMARLHGRLGGLEIGLAAAPVRAAALPAEAIAPAANLVEEAVSPPPTEVAVLPRMEITAEDPLQALLYEALESLPEATLIGLTSRDGLGVEVVSRKEQAAGLPLEVELTDLGLEATRIAAALGTGPLLTLAFRAGAEQCLVSPVGEDHFAFLLVPADSVAEFRRAQAILLQATSRLSESF